MILGRKMIRDMLANAGSYLACLVLVTLGMISFLAFAIARDNLVLAKEVFYREQSFADGFIELTAMPLQHLNRIRSVVGVEQVTGRLVRDVQVYKPDQAASVYLRMVSLDLKEKNRLNDVMLQQGRPLRDKALEAWLDQQFFSANQLEIGRTIEIIAGGRVRELAVAGVGLSPEFVYPLRTEFDIYNDPELFGIAYVPLKIMWQLFPDHDKAVNSVVFTLAAEADFDAVKDRLEDDLDRYGVLEIYPREDQTSHFILREEIEVIETMATFFPVMILSIAGFIIYIVLKRLVEQQRGQIGILKAFGYRRRQIVLHYFSYSLSLAVVGGGIGGLLGMWLASPLTGMLYQFFHLPEVYAGFSWRHLVMSILICLSVLGFAGYHGCKAVLRLTPAQAMQPPAPAHGRRNRLEKIKLFAAMLTVQGKMAVRNLSRSRSRTTFVFFGLTISCAMVAFTWALARETMPKFMFYQYEEVQTYDAKINLENPRCRKSVRSELARWPGLSRVEAMAEVPVKLSYRWARENIMLLGLESNARLYNILDVEGNRVAPSSAGLILSQRLADNLGARVGSMLELESWYARDPDETVEVPVVGVVPQYIGMNAYMEINALNDLLRQGRFASSFSVQFGGGGGNDDVHGQVAALREYYRESDQIAGIDARLEQVELMLEYWEAAGWIIFLYVMIGVIFSFAIIYISSLVILSERQRELASMRVLGMTSGEVLAVITFEQWLLAVFAVVASVPLARGILRSFAHEWSTDMYSMPAEMSTGSIVMGVIITCASIWTAQRFAMRKIKRLDLVAVLKTRE